MRRLVLVVVAVAMLLSVAPGHVLVHRQQAADDARVGRAERNAFLNKRVRTHAQLMRQVERDDVVMDRYMRHFGMTRKQVIDLFSGLHLSKTKEDAVFLVYNVPESGELRARSIFYKKGTKVWADPTGKPVLKASCGNPLVRGTDKVDQPVLADLEPGQEAQPDLTALAQAGDTVPSDLVAMEAPADLEAAPAELGEFLLPGLPATVPGVVPGVPTFNSLNPIGIISTFGILVMSHGSSSPAQSVPEPASMFALFGLAGLAARRARRRSRATGILPGGFAGSSKGRTAVFGAVSLGSSPSPAATVLGSSGSFPPESPVVASNESGSAGARGGERATSPPP